MAGNNIEEIPTSTTNETIETVEAQETLTHGARNNTSDEQEPNPPPKKTDYEIGVDKSKKSARILLIIVNVCTLIFSLILFVLGVIMTVNHARVHEEWHAAYGFWNASIICIVISLILAGLGSIGLLGAIRENRCLLITFSITLGLLVCIEIGLSVALLALAKAQNLGSVVEDKMLSSMSDYDQPGYEGVNKVWDVVQTELKCCGVREAKDWFKYFSRRNLNSKKFLPESCCATKPLEISNGDRTCTYCTGTCDHPHNPTGCLGALESSIKRNEGVIAGVIVIVALGQIGLIVASIHLMKNAKKPSSCSPCY